MYNDINETEEGYRFSVEDQLFMVRFELIMLYREGKTIEELSQNYPRDWIIDILTRNKDI